MSRIATRELARRFRDQHGVVSRSQLQALGVSRNMVQHRLGTGEWEKLSPKTVRLAGSARTPGTGPVRPLPHRRPNSRSVAPVCRLALALRRPT